MKKRDLSTLDSATAANSAAASKMFRKMTVGSSYHAIVYNKYASSKSGYFNILWLPINADENYIVIPYDKCKSEKDGIKSLIARGIPAIPEPVFSDLVLKPGDAFTIASKIDPVCKSAGVLFKEYISKGCVFVKVTDSMFRFLYDEKTIFSEPVNGDPTTVVATGIQPSLSLYTPGSLSDAIPLSYDAVREVLIAYAPRPVDKFKYFVNCPSIPGSGDFTQMTSEELYAAGKGQKYVCAVEIDNRGYYMDLPMGDVCVCGCVIPKTMSTTHGTGISAKTTYTFKCKPKDKEMCPAIMGEDKGLVLDSFVTIDDKPIMLSAVFWTEEVYKFGVRTISRWEAVARHILAGLRACVAIEIDRTDTLESGMFTESVKAGYNKITYTGTGYFLAIDYQTTFRSCGFLVSRRFALSTIARALFSDEHSYMEGAPPLDLPFDNLAENRSAAFAPQVPNPDASAVKSNTSTASTVQCFMLNEYHGETAPLLESVWDFFFVPGEALIDTRCYSTWDRKAYAKFFSYNEANSKPDALKLNEEFIARKYLPDSEAMKNLPSAFFFAVRKPTH